MLNPQDATTEGEKWLQNNWPNMRRMDMDWTAARYDYPSYVCEYIKQNWVKVSDHNGGTYQKPY